MKKGRPFQSQIRQNITEILYFMKEGYGYDIYKAYVEIFPAVTMRSIYYHLRTGAALGEFEVKKVKVENGSYSWGSTAEKVYYSLGKNAKPKIDPRVKEWWEKRKIKVSS